MSRTNCSYGAKVLVRTIILPIEIGHRCQKPLNDKHISILLEHIEKVHDFAL